MKEETPNSPIVQPFECPGLLDFQIDNVRGPLPTQRGNTVINLPTHTPVVTATNNNQLSQSPEGSVLDSQEDNFTNQNQLLQSLEAIRMDSE